MTGRLLLGIDTGGTCTDAVLLDEARMAEGPPALIAKAKALTTRDDLVRGIANAVDAVLAAAPPDAAGRIALASLSTTLATNALVEGTGDRVALVMIGFAPRDLDRAGLAEALGPDPLVAVAGGHDALGTERAPLDRKALEAGLRDTETDAVAICGHFAVRNPAHEVEAARIARGITGLPVTLSHALSARVGGPRRGLTALLNARLVGLIERLVGASEAMLARRGIRAPLMVVRGDGALVSAAFARSRPIETILSGPAASLVGAAWLTGVRDAIVADIGGTTTDIAILLDARPALDPEGARVGRWRTLVEAVAMTTHGLGGDSEVTIGEGTRPALTLGPRRVVPLALLADEHGTLVHGTLARQMRTRPARDDARFLLPQGTPRRLDPHEAALWHALDGEPAAADRVLVSLPLRRAAERLVRRGLLLIAGPAPTDAAHVAGRQSGWDRAAAETGLACLARQRTAAGTPAFASAPALADAILEALARRSAELVLDAALAADGWTGPEPSRAPLAQAALNGHRGLAVPTIALSVPLIGLGAPAPALYPDVAARLGTTDATPAHADVANAIGAVAAGVRLSLTATVTRPEEGRYRIHLDGTVETHPDLDRALAEARAGLDRRLRALAAEAGAAEVSVTFREERDEAVVEGRPMLLEARIEGTAAGRPRLAG